MTGDAGRVLAVGASPDFSFRGAGVAVAATASGLRIARPDLRAWRAVCAPPGEPLPVTAAAFAPDYPATPLLLAGVPGGVLRCAVDGGADAAVVPLTVPPPVVSALLASPAYARDGAWIAATVEDGIFRSEDGGRSWQPASVGLLDRHVLCLAPSASGDSLVFAGAESGVFVSRNAGRSWRETPFPEAAGPVLSLACTPRALLAGTESAGVWASADAGQTWSCLAPLDEGTAVNQIIPHAGYPSVPHLVVLANDRPIVSRDRGKTWHPWSAAYGDGVSAIAAPEGIHRGAALLVGRASGDVLAVPARDEATDSPSSSGDR